ncbi:MAG: hypothetical protein LW688_04215 [Cryomorphaceae bacterium]|jgi:hypothetical protein|nr:hypothetical protein [Cryomorphaceae bacterium]
MKSGGYSNTFNQCSNALKELEKKFSLDMDHVARQWKDQRQRDFYGKYMQRMHDQLKDTIRTFNQMELQIKSIENELNRFK